MKIQFKEVTDSRPYTLPTLIPGNLYRTQNMEIGLYIYGYNKLLYSLHNGNVWAHESAFGDDTDYIWEDVTNKFILVEKD